MKINVKGEHVSEKIIHMYVDELIKAHPDKHINAVDIIVEGDAMKARKNRRNNIPHARIYIYNTAYFMDRS